jgi:caffeoyl-CoA O-methyltransferase
MATSYLPLSDPLYQYLLRQRSDAADPILPEIRRESERLGDVGRMAISAEQGSLLTLLSALVGARHAVEVGTFTGSSSVCIARGLAPGGRLVCFDKDFRWTSIARRYWFKAGVQDRIELRLGDAHAMLARYRPNGPLDLVFIDADKESYDFYYEALLPHVRANGLIIFDNMLRGGKVIDPVACTDPAVRAIDELNRKLADDPRIQSVLISVADGLHLCRKLTRGY